MHEVNRKAGFTLIELLVVIAIIAILAAILFPVFAQAREAARTSSCLSNTKQVSLGILQYVQDYDERYPIWVYDTTSNTTPDTPWGPWLNHHQGWDKQVQPYIKSVQVFKCPDVGDGIETQANPPDGHDDSAPTGATNYYMNAYLAGRDIGNRAGRKLAQVRYPAVTILIGETTSAASTGAVFCEIDWMEWGWQGGHAHKLNGDGNAGSGNGPNYPNYNALCHQGVGSEWGTPASLRRHKGGANYAMSDGHSKFFQGDASCAVWNSAQKGSNQPELVGRPAKSSREAAPNPERGGSQLKRGVTPRRRGYELNSFGSSQRQGGPLGEAREGLAYGETSGERTTRKACIPSGMPLYGRSNPLEPRRKLTAGGDRVPGNRDGFSYGAKP